MEKQKQNKKIFLIFVFLLLASPLILAQTTTEESKAGLTPDSPFWGIEVAMEKIRMFLTSGQDNKIDYGLQIADERLAEIKIMVKEGKMQDANKAEIERDKDIGEVEENMAKGLSAEHRAFVLTMLQKHIDVLTMVKEEAPEQAQTGLENAIEKSSMNLERMKTLSQTPAEENSFKNVERNSWRESLE